MGLAIIILTNALALGGAAYNRWGEPEAVLLGSAMIGAVASGAQPTLLAAMGAMSAADRVVEPAGGAVRACHDAKYRVFHRMYEDQLAYARLME